MLRKTKADIGKSPHQLFVLVCVSEIVAAVYQIIICYFTAHEHYVQNGILAAVLLNSGAADFVITGCGTGEGAMLACNAFPQVLCGHIESPLDAYLFSQVNDGNCIALPFAENFGWGGELNLTYIFEKLFFAPGGGGYPKERVVPEQRNKKILDEVKKVTHRDLVSILKELDRDLVIGALSGDHFSEYFFANCKDEAIAACVKELIG